MHYIVSSLLIWIHGIVDAWGYTAVVILMAIESANIPLPSEAIMPAAGYLVQQGKLSFHLVALSGAIGCLVGSVPSYWLGRFGGRPFLEKYGRWLLLKTKDLETADRWVDKYGDGTFLVCRMLPMVRTFISFPAGVLKAHFGTFCLFTFLGSLIWCYFLAYIGIVFGEHLEFFVKIWHQFDLLIGLVVLAAGGYYLYLHLKPE
jgi:membrane protein DedA with SNARE-associated domain